RRERAGGVHTTLVPGPATPRPRSGADEIGSASHEWSRSCGIGAMASGSPRYMWVWAIARPALLLLVMKVKRVRVGKDGVGDAFECALGARGGQVPEVRLVVGVEDDAELFVLPFQGRWLTVDLAHVVQVVVAACTRDDVGDRLAVQLACEALVVVHVPVEDEVGRAFCLREGFVEDGADIGTGAVKLVGRVDRVMGGDDQCSVSRSRSDLRGDPRGLFGVNHAVLGNVCV